jgi:hypothetical protein
VVKFSTLGGLQAQVSNVASAVNYLQFTGSPTTKAVEFDALGSDSNISMAFQPKGTGAIDLAAGSSGVNISNGGTVTAITRTGQGFNYTSIPSVAISAPTTAGGVQATATTSMFINTATVSNGGTGYAVGNVLTVVGGTPTSSSATLTVTAVSSGVITSVSSTNFAQYSALPSAPFSVTGGAGSGATFTPLWGNGTIFTITNAGSGYIEQPTVTFSGGGGSGAAAYASVGSSAIFKGLAGSGSSSFSFFSPAGEALRIHDVGGSAVNFLRVQGGVAGNTPVLLAAGSDSNVTLALRTQGTGSVSFQTGGVTQAVVAHTASAVNYVQVTGGATGNPATVTLSAQGSDSNVNLALTPKGTGAVVINNAVTMSATTEAINISTSQTTGNLTIGGTAQTGAIAIGRSTGNQTISIGSGALGSTVTTGGTRAINIGSTSGGTGVSNVTIGKTSSSVDHTTNINGRYINLNAGTALSLGSANLGLPARINQTVDIVDNLIAGVTGARAFVTDALSPIFGSIVVSGGAVAVPVYYDGTNWRVG